jgi:hypothetical protein
MTKAKKIQLFDLYFPSAMTGVLSNPDIVNSICLIHKLNGTENEVQQHLTNAAGTYAHFMIKTRENFVNNILNKNETKKQKKSE